MVLAVEDELLRLGASLQKSCERTAVATNAHVASDNVSNLGFA
jgi:hypothetical protein